MAQNMVRMMENANELKNRLPGRQWYGNFKQRHPEYKRCIDECRPIKRKRSSGAALDNETANQYFMEFKHAMEKASCIDNSSKPGTSNPGMPSLHFTEVLHAWKDCSRRGATPMLYSD